MKKWFSTFLCILFFSITINACNIHHPNSNDIEINENASWFSDFVILDDKVFFLCSYEIQNSSEKTVFVRLVGDFTKEQEIRLIQENTLQAVRTDMKDISEISTDFLSNANLEYENGEMIEIKPGRNRFSILYVGTNAGNAQRPNRLLPETKVYVCK